MTEEERIKMRIYQVLPSYSLQLNEFLKITKIRFDNPDVTSAAISFGKYPTLYLDKDFLNEHCQSDEHLFMLVMHELYHVILGHTKLYPRITELDNYCFDAMINSMLCKQFPETRYTSFFTTLYTDDGNGCLLRPEGEKTPKRFHPLLKELYQSDNATYYEIYKMVVKNAANLSIKSVPLLGNHSNFSSENNEKTIEEFIERFTENWNLSGIGKKAGVSKDVREKSFSLSKIDMSNFRIIKYFVGLFRQEAANHHKLKRSFVSLDSQTYFINFKDRMSFTKRLLGEEIIPYSSEVWQERILPVNYGDTLFYLDVSGSLQPELNNILPLLERLLKKNQIRCFAFSNQIFPFTLKDYRSGKYRTTSGTDVNAVFQNYFENKLDRRYRKIILLTDGFFGRINDNYVERIRKERICIGLILTPDGEVDCSFRNNVKYKERRLLKV